MDNNENNNVVVSPDELKADEEIQKGVTDEELKEKVIADFGLNPDEQPELIEKIVNDRKAAHARLTDAIGQKIKYREKATTKPAEEKKEESTFKPEDVDKIVDQKLAEKELSKLSLPEELKTEIRDLAKLKNISVGEATELPYIQSKIAEVKKEERVINGTPIRINVGSKIVTIDLSKPLNPSEFDLSTEEGRKGWNEAKAEKEKYRQSHK